MINQRTLTTLDELENAKWFSNVGRVDSEYPLFLDSWEDAVRHCESDQWESLCQEAANQYRARLLDGDPERFRNWNSTVREVKQLSIPLVLRKTQHIVKQKHLSKSFIDTVQWDILHLCMESEYADVFPPGFYASQAYWYASGHFPCGWEGEFPNGRLIVF
jgi:hypothetical protein